MNVSGIGKSHIGRVRAQNQDTILVKNDALGVLPNLYVVADGLGGHQSGEVASRRAIEAFCAFFDGLEGEGCEGELLSAALLYANKKVYEDAINIAENRGMGTTFSVVATCGQSLHYAHVGDSRIYLYMHDGGLVRLTTDHISVTAELLAQGLITQEEAARYPATVLSRAVGTDVDVKIDLGVALLDGAKYAILCSDGLYNMLTDGEIATIVAAERDLDVMTEKLIAAANKAGGKDNISVIVIGWDEL